jgi:ADP-ribose pyrophosphatase
LTIKANEPVFAFDLIERDSAGRLLFHYVIIDLLAEYVNGEARPADDVSDAAWFSPDDVDHLDMSETTQTLLRKIGFLNP